MNIIINILFNEIHTNTIKNKFQKKKNLNNFLLT